MQTGPKQSGYEVIYFKREAEAFIGSVTVISMVIAMTMTIA